MSFGGAFKEPIIQELPYTSSHAHLQYGYYRLPGLWVKVCLTIYCICYTISVGYDCVIWERGPCAHSVCVALQRQKCNLNRSNQVK